MLDLILQLLPRFALSRYSTTPTTSQMAPYTTSAQKAVICTMRKAGYSNDEIRAALTGRHEITNRQILRIFKQYGEKENYEDVGHSTGRPHKMTPADKCPSPVQC